MNTEFNLNEKYLFSLLPLRSILFLLAFLLLTICTEKDLTALSKWWSVIATAINLIIILLLILICKKENFTLLKLLRFKKDSSKPLNTIFIIFLILMIGMGGMYLAGALCYQVFPYMAPMMVTPIPMWIALINLFLLPISTTFAEDGIYLGLGVNCIKNKWAAILLPAFFYALQHCFIPTLFDCQYMLYRFFSFLPLTVFICYLYYKKRNPLPIMIGHLLLNLATAVSILGTSAFPEAFEAMLLLK